MADRADDDLEDLYEHAPCGYLSMRRDGTIMRVNATLLSWLGVTREELVGRRFQDLLTTPGRIYHDTHYMPLLTMQGHAKEIAFDLLRHDAPALPTIVTTIGVYSTVSGRARRRSQAARHASASPALRWPSDTQFSR